MNFKMVVKQRGVIVEQSGGTAPDPIGWMGTNAIAGGAKASVDARVSHWGENVSISFSVSLECPQTTEWVQAAGQAASNEATKYVNELASRFDKNMPMLPTSG